PGFPIRTPPDQSLVDDSPGPIVASHVLHRFLVPRHPPCALKNLATDARVHCAVLKQRPTTHHPEQKLECTGAGTEGDLAAVPSDTQQRARHPRSLVSRSTPKQY